MGMKTAAIKFAVSLLIGLFALPASASFVQNIFDPSGAQIGTLEFSTFADRLLSCRPQPCVNPPPPVVKQADITLAGVNFSVDDLINRSTWQIDTSQVLVQGLFTFDTQNVTDLIDSFAIEVRNGQGSIILSNPVLNCERSTVPCNDPGYVFITALPDSLTLRPSSVDAPSPFALLGLGLAGLGYVRCRQIEAHKPHFKSNTL